MRQQWSLEGWILYCALEQAFFNLLSTTLLLNLIPAKLLLQYVYNTHMWMHMSRGEEKLLYSSPIPDLYVLFLYFCAPYLVVAGKLQENIRGQRQ